MSWASVTLKIASKSSTVVQSWYKNLDKLIDAVNADGRAQALYSTPQIYYESKAKYKRKWPLKVDDYFPYADQPHAFWTGVRCCRFRCGLQALWIGDQRFHKQTLPIKLTFMTQRGLSASSVHTDLCSVARRNHPPNASVQFTS